MVRELASLETEVTAALHNLDSRETQLSPTLHPGKWSIQQIVEHLLLTYRSTAEVMEARLAKGRPTQATPTLGQRLAQFGICTLGIFPGGLSAPAGVMPTMPATLRSGAQLGQRVRTELCRVDALTMDAQKMFGSGKAVSHGRLGPLSVAQWRRFHLVHGRHHVKQILSIRQDHGV